MHGFKSSRSFNAEARVIFLKYKFDRSFHKGSRAEAGGIVRLLLLDSWSEMIVAWFTAVSGEMMRNGWILDIF